MSNYFEKYIKYKKKYSLINLKSSGGSHTAVESDGSNTGVESSGSHTAVESDGLLIAKDIHQYITQQITLFPDDPDDPNIQKKKDDLTNLLTVEQIVKIAQIPTLSDLCNIASTQNTQSNKLLMTCIKRHILPFIINSKRYYQSILNFLKNKNSDLYKYYKEESDKINLNIIIEKLQPYLKDLDSPENESMQNLSIDLFDIKNTQLIAKKLFDFIVNYNSICSYIGFGWTPKSVTLTVILLLSCVSNSALRSQETFVLVTQRMVDIIMSIRTHINSNITMAPELKQKYVDCFPDNDLAIRQMYL